MTFTPDVLLAELARHEAQAGRPARYVVAFSGGPDSTALLIALAETRTRHGRDLLGVHVNHRLHPDADRWASHCADVSRSLRIDYRCETVRVEAGAGPEAAARDARYAALERHVHVGDWLLTAHHREDQAETLLLQLLRGGGMAGIAGIRACRAFAHGYLVRPLLDIARHELVEFVDAQNVACIDDPSNADSRFDRNYLRNEVLPLIERRWPHARARLARSAALAREAVELLDALADDDIRNLGDNASRLDLVAFRQLPRSRQKNLLRRAVQRAALPPVPAPQLARIIDEVAHARDDAGPRVTWAGAEARRFRDALYLQHELPPCRFEARELGHDGVDLGPGMGRLTLERGAATGLADAVVAAGLTLRRRRGGEEIRPAGQRHTRKLKKLLHEAGVLPWWRDRVPLVYSGDRLVAVADLWLAAEASEPGGSALVWRDRPPIA